MIDDTILKDYLTYKVKEKGIVKIIMRYKEEMESIEEYKPRENKYWFILFLIFYPFVIFYCFILNLL